MVCVVFEDGSAPLMMTTDEVLSWRRVEGGRCVCGSVVMGAAGKRRVR